jgi:hypothetical protein
MVAVGGMLVTGGLTGGAIGMAEDGTAGGESAAFNVTRTVSFLSGTLEVCLDGGGVAVAIGVADMGATSVTSEALNVTRMVSFLRGTLDVCFDGGGSGGWFSLMRSQVFIFNRASKKISKSPVKLPARDFSEITASRLFR